MRHQSASRVWSQLGTVPIHYMKPWHGLCSHILAGDLSAQFDTQRRRAIIFRFGGAFFAGTEGRPAAY